MDIGSADSLLLREQRSPSFCGSSGGPETKEGIARAPDSLGTWGNFRAEKLYQLIYGNQRRLSSTMVVPTEALIFLRAPVRERMSNGYLLIAASGGLNQQRVGITDGVVVARILNATLVVPELDHHCFWKDNSDFVDIFDVDCFISSFSKDVPIVKRIPDKVMRSMEKPPYIMRVPQKPLPEYYLEEVLPILLRRRVVRLTKFDYRLSNSLEAYLQKLQYRVNYHALWFTRPIRGDCCLQIKCGVWVVDVTLQFI